MKPSYLKLVASNGEILVPVIYVAQYRRRWYPPIKRLDGNESKPNWVWEYVGMSAIKDVNYETAQDHESRD